MATAQKSFTALRSGVTLAECLVSMLIMSIGIVLLATLLPISILRTAQATQLTHAVLLRNNAEAVVESNIGMLSNSQICGFQGTAIVDPLGYFLTGPNTTSTSFGSYSLVAPNARIIRSSGGILNVAQLDQSLTPAQLTAALIQADQLATLPDSWTKVRDDFVTGYNAAAATVTVKNSTTDLHVRNGENPFNAVHRIVLTDSTGKNAVMRSLFRAAGTPTAGTSVGTNDLSWQNVNGSGVLVSSPQIPVGFVPTSVRIESRDRRFTWLMTVRKRWIPSGFLLGPDGLPGVANFDDDNRNGVDDPGEQHIAGSDDDPNWAAEIELAVFFNRSFKANDETSHVVAPILLGFDGAPGVVGVDDDGNGTVDDASEIGWLGSDDNRTVIVQLANKPSLKKGGYMLEPSQLKWYRISNLTPITSTSTTATLLLDQDIRTAPATPISQGILMGGVIEVYALGSRTGQQ